MRRKKIEEIRRLVSAAAAMCDLSSLDGVKRRLAEAARELGGLEHERTNKISAPEKNAIKVVDPRAALRAIEMEINRHREKISDGQAPGIINE